MAVDMPADDGGDDVAEDMIEQEAQAAALRREAV
jgi:hypothetical protein